MELRGHMETLLLRRRRFPLAPGTPRADLAKSNPAFSTGNSRAAGANPAGRFPLGAGRHRGRCPTGAALSTGGAVV